MWWISRSFTEKILEDLKSHCNGSEIALTRFAFNLWKGRKVRLAVCSPGDCGSGMGEAGGFLQLEDQAWMKNQKGGAEKFFTFLFELPLSIHWANCVSCLHFSPISNTIIFKLILMLSSRPSVILLCFVFLSMGLRLGWRGCAVLMGSGAQGLFLVAGTWP